MTKNQIGIGVLGVFLSLSAWVGNEKKLYEITTPLGVKYIMQSDELYEWQILTDPKNPEAGITIMRNGKEIASISETEGYRFIAIRGSNSPLGGVRVTDKGSDGYLDEITYFPKGGLTVDSDFDGQADSKISFDGDTLHWYLDGWWVEKTDNKGGIYIERNGVRIPASYSSGKWVFGTADKNSSNNSYMDTR